eukprot:2189879-Pleurochrysis_carterae.AAC.2
MPTLSIRHFQKKDQLCSATSCECPIASVNLCCAPWAEEHSRFLASALAQAQERASKCTFASVYTQTHAHSHALAMRRNIVLNS